MVFPSKLCLLKGQSRLAARVAVLAAATAFLVTLPGVVATSLASTRLFASGFESATGLGAPSSCYTSCWQNLTGTNSVTGNAWPPKIWGGTASLQVLADTYVTSSTVGNYITHQIPTVVGPFGNSTKALYSEIRQRGGWSTQDLYLIRPATGIPQGDLYISFSLKFQPDLLAKMGPNGWRAFFAWKTNGDYRVEVYVYTDASGKPYWYMQGDNNANGGLPYQRFWAVSNKSVPVQVGQWFRFEIFWHRAADASGRIWAAASGTPILDRWGPNIGQNGAAINRIMTPLLYTGGVMPAYQWVDDLEIWDGFPCGVGKSCGRVR